MRPSLDVSDQGHGDIDGAGFALLFEGQTPAGLGAARAFKGTQVAFQEQARLGQFHQSGVAPEHVPVWREGAFI